MTPDPSNPVPHPSDRRWSRLAIVSLVLGLVPCGLAGIPAWTCGFLARRRIRDSGGALRGRGIALAGQVLGVIWLVLSAAALAFPLFMQWRADADPTPALRRLEAHQRLTRRFVQEHGGHLPAGNWPDLLAMQAEADGGELPPGFDGFGWGRAFGINSAVAGLPVAEVRDPAHTVLYFELPSGTWQREGDASSMRPPTRSRPRLVGFVDGAVRLVGPEGLSALKWTP